MQIRKIICFAVMPALIVLTAAQNTEVNAVNLAKRAYSATAVRTVKTEWKPRPSSNNNFTGYTPAQLRTAYGIDGISGTGAGETIALVECYGDLNLESDLSTFSKKFNLPDASLTVEKTGTLKDASDEADWAAETALDTEWAHALAPDASLLVVEAENESTDAMLSAVDKATASGAKVVSMSWGWNEASNDAAADSHFAHSGVAYVAAAGDSGAGAVWPAASPNVIAVGGTTLMLSSSGTRLAETGWTNSGGGISRVENQPTWQQAISLLQMDPFRMLWGRPAQVSRRMTPDVSFDADPVTGVAVYCSVVQTSGHGTQEKGWITLGGTSLGAPCWAGVIADLDAKGVSVTSPSSLYAASDGANGLDSSNAFYDVVGGSNGYFATAGYDLVTGLGSPQGDQLITALKSSSAAVTTAAKSTSNSGSASASPAMRANSGHMPYGFSGR